CPPAPSECALMLHDYLESRAVRGECEISFVLPLSTPVPPSPETSKALVAAFAERNIKFHPSKRVVKIDAARKMVFLDDNSEMAFDLFLGVPKHRVPSVVLDSGLAENGWVTVNPRTLETKYPGIYALGDGANTGTPKAGVFAEGAAKAVASALIAKVKSGGVRESLMVSAPAILSSAAAASAKWRWISSLGPSRLEPITSPRSGCVPTR